MILPHDEHGDGAPLVLLHAGVADRSMWSDHLPPLGAAGHRALALDLPGFGDADAGPEPLAPWRDVLATMDALGIARAALVGNSWGAGMALRAAAIAPHRVSHLVLVSAGDPWRESPSSRLAAAWQAEEAALAAGSIDGAVDAVLAAWTQPGAPDELRERVGAMQRRIFIEHAAEPEPEYAPDPLADGPGARAGIRCPVLCLAGEHDMPDFAEAALGLAAALPDGRHAVIAGAGHLAPLETPESFRTILLEFLAA
ncbi:MAG: alpha/beta hydrolase [Solirubrobacteraceae bacterium]